MGDRAGKGEDVIRSTVLLDPDGTVRKVWYGVKADGHAADVLAALETLANTNLRIDPTNGIR